MIFNISAFTHKGSNRTVNQDRILVNGNLLSEGKINLKNESSCICFVADGVGGNKKGEFASQFVLDALKKDLCGDFDEFTRHLRIINSDLIEISKKDISIEGTATTLTGIYIDSDSFYVFHAGDSELWYLRNNMFSKATTDQTVDGSLNSPIISYLGGLEDNLSPEIGISLDSSEENDCYLLCSDGLFKSLKFDEVKSVLQESKTVSEKINILLDLALSKGAPDNISVILMQRSDINVSNEKENQQFDTSKNNATGIVSNYFNDSPTGIINSGSNYTDKTGIVGGLSDKTGVVSINDSVNTPVSFHGFKIGDTIVLKQKSYQIKNIISEGTGEASVYLVSDEKSNALALKLYKKFDNPRYEPNPEALARIKEIKNPDILKLIDYGVGLDKFRGDFCYELSVYAEGGDLQNCSIKNGLTIDFIENKLIPEIFFGIRILHEKRIIHCDLKPGNIFFLDKDKTDLVIGDYGSAITFELASQNEIQGVTTVKGTNHFMAPEQGEGIVSEKNDYYSLGMILLSMVYPDSLNSLRDIQLRRLKKIKILDFNEKYKRINNLIEGLTLHSFEHRFGRKELEKWIDGENSIVRYSGLFNNVIPVKLGNGKQILTGEDFIKLIETDNQWYEKYIENIASWSQFLIWLNSYKDMEARSVFEGVRKHYESRGKEFLKEAFIRFFEPTRIIRIDTTEFDFHNATNLKSEVEKFCNKIDEIWKFTRWEILRFYLFQFEFSLRQLALINQSSEAIALSDKLLTSFGIQPNEFNELKAEIHININDRKLDTFRRNLVILFYAFNPKRGFRDDKNIEYTTLDEMALFFVKQPNLFNELNLHVEKEIFLEKIKFKQLSSLNYKSLVFEIFKNQAQTEIEFISLTFDKYRNNELAYKFYKSLNSFLNSKNIHIDFTDRSDHNLNYAGKRKLFQPFWKYNDEVVDDISRKHNIVTLTEENKSRFKKSFVIRSLKRYAYIYAGQALALSILIPSFYLLYMIKKDRISIDENWNFFRGSSPSAVVMDTFIVEIGIVTEELPLYVKPKAKSSIRLLNDGDTLRYLDNYQGHWEQVVFRNDTGWICPEFRGKLRVDKRIIKKTKIHQP